MSSLISSVAWHVDFIPRLLICISHTIFYFSRVKRGISAQQPSKYVLDDKELGRVSALARIELEDARLELERAHEAAKTMGRGAEGDEGDDDGDEDAWVE